MINIRVFLPVVHIGSTTFATKVATRIRSLDGNRRNVDGRHVAATFDAEKLVRRIPFHFLTFRANAGNKHNDNDNDNSHWRLIASFDAETAPEQTQQSITSTQPQQQRHERKRKWQELAANADTPPAGASAVGASLAQRAEPTAERTGRRQLKGLVGGSLAWFMVIDCD